MIMTSISTSRVSNGRHARRASPVRLIVGLFAAATAITGCRDDITRPGITPGPGRQPATTGASFTCAASVREATVSCAQTRAPRLGASANIIGGQDTYIRLSSSGTSYDAGTQIFSTNVTVQSLVQTLIGTTDSTTVDGMSVFFNSGPTVTSGTGSISVFNPDGTGAFTGSNQPYFQYNEILEPYEISQSHLWMFEVPATVNTFEFVVYVSTPVVDIDAPMLDAVWGGTVSSDWATAGNWQTGSVPDSGSVVAIPRASLLDPSANSPTLSGNFTFNAIRVGEASTLDLALHTLDVTGNVDAPGTITNGIVRLPGADAHIGGNLPSLEISGAATLQRSTTASGAVSVTGTLTVHELPLSIAIP